MVNQFVVFKIYNTSFIPEILLTFSCLFVIVNTFQCESTHCSFLKNATQKCRVLKAQLTVHRNLTQFDQQSQGLMVIFFSFYGYKTCVKLLTSIGKKICFFNIFSSFLHYFCLFVSKLGKKEEKYDPLLTFSCSIS